MSRKIATAMRHRERMRRTVRHIERRLAEDPAAAITLRELADIACMAPHHFLRSFRHHTGETPIGLLRALRLDLARRALLPGGHTVAEIADRCGYQCLSAFGRAYRRRFGTSPGQSGMRITAPCLRIDTVHLRPAVYRRIAGDMTSLTSIFDELIARMDAAGAPREAQSIGAILTSDGAVVAAAFENALLPEGLALDTGFWSGGHYLRMAGQPGVVWPEWNRRAQEGRTRSPVLLRYGNDPAYTHADAQRIAIYAPLDR